MHGLEPEWTYWPMFWCRSSINCQPCFSPKVCSQALTSKKPVPDEAGRLHILRIQTKDMPLTGDVDLADLAKHSQGYTGADLGDVVRRAGLLALRGDIASPAVGRTQFEQALRESRPSVTPEMEQEYEQLRRSLKQQGPLVQRPRIGFQLD